MWFYSTQEMKWRSASRRNKILNVNGRNALLSLPAINLYSVIPSSFSLPYYWGYFSTKWSSWWFWDTEQFSAKPDTPKQQNIAEPAHTGTTHKVVPLGMGSYYDTLQGFRNYSLTSWTTCPPAEEHLETWEEGDHGSALLVEVTPACSIFLRLN